MKTKTVFLPLSLVLFALSLGGCATSPGQARGDHSVLRTAQAPDFPLPLAAAGEEEVVPSHQTLTRAVADMDKREVLQWLGRPAERLTADFWIYWRYHTPEDAAANGGHDTLIVAFERGHVSTMRLVQAEVLRTRLAGGWRPRSALAQR